MSRPGVAAHAGVEAWSAGSDAPPGYEWEPSSATLAARYGLPIERIVRFDTNTRPAPPELAARLLAAGRFEPALSEYPPNDYGPLATAAAAAYGVRTDELVVGAGADEILELVAKAGLRAGDAAIVPSPTYAMYRVVTEQRGGHVLDVPRLGAAGGYALDVPAIRAAARRATLVWLCDPNNPTGRQEPVGTIEAVLDGLARDARADGRQAPLVAVDEAYAEFVERSALELLDRYPRLVVVRTLSKAYGLAGLRVGFALGRRPVVEPIERYRPPGPVSTVSAVVGAAALGEPAIARDFAAATAAERERFAAGLTRLGWRPEPSVANFLLVRFEDPGAAAAAAEALLRRGLVPRTFGPGHPLADALRLTVRTPVEDDRLLQAAAAHSKGVGAGGTGAAR